MRSGQDYAQRDGYTVQRQQTYAWPDFGHAEPTLVANRDTTLNLEKAL